MFNFEEELKKLPHTPGVYLMHNKTDEIIYVGKAIDLYNRVHQYFQAGYKRSPKIEKMVSHIACPGPSSTDSGIPVDSTGAPGPSPDVSS